MLLGKVLTQIQALTHAAKVVLVAQKQAQPAVGQKAAFLVATKQQAQPVLVLVVDKN